VSADLSCAIAIIERLPSGRLFEYLARRPGNRATTVRCPRGRAGTQRVQVVGARGRCRRNGEKMSDRQLSDADRALRARTTELSVHIPCGRLRGPTRPTNNPYGPKRWQSCPDEDSPEKWEGHDVSRERDLCIICFRATAGGTSRWSWLACDDCRAINDRIGSRWGFRPFALGRHSLMNGIGVREGSPPVVEQAQIERLVEFARSRGGLRGWHNCEYSRLASNFDPLTDIPLKMWQQEWPPSKSASRDAFTRIFGGLWPLSPTRTDER
jgi:hypothetical protein